jgi:hypothetical protein
VSEIELSERTPLRLPGPTWPKRFLIGASVLGLLAFARAYLAVFLDMELREANAEAERLDPGWHIPELEAKRAHIPDEENSALVLLAAKELMPPKWPFWDHREMAQDRTAEEEFHILQEGFENLSPIVQLDERQVDALRKELERAEKALAVARKVIELPYGRYPITYSKDVHSTPMDNMQGARFMGSVLVDDALMRAQDKDLNGALASCRGVLNCGRSLGDEPRLHSMLVRLALNNIARRQVERILAQGEALEAALSSVQHEFEEEAESPLFLIAARGERGEMDGFMQAIQDGEADPATVNMFPGGRLDGFQLISVPGVAKRVRAALLKHNNRFVEIAKLPVEQQAASLVELKPLVADLPAPGRFFCVATQKLSRAFHRDKAELRCAIAMVAVERYRQANNRWPDALTDLIPRYLANVSLDPFDGAPLRYHRLTDGIVVYSVGYDGKDNGGKFDKDPRKEGTDLGLRLWDVARRGQRPKPRGGAKGKESE